MAELSNQPWGLINASDYENAEAFCNACLIDMNPAGKSKTKALCKPPVKEPGGMLNASGIRAAATALAGARGGVDAPAEAQTATALGPTPPGVTVTLPSCRRVPLNIWSASSRMARRSMTGSTSLAQRQQRGRP